MALRVLGVGIFNWTIIYYLSMIFQSLVLTLSTLDSSLHSPAPLIFSHTPLFNMQILQQIQRIHLWLRAEESEFVTSHPDDSSVHYILRAIAATLTVILSLNSIVNTFDDMNYDLSTSLFWMTSPREHSITRCWLKPQGYHYLSRRQRNTSLIEWLAESKEWH